MSTTINHIDAGVTLRTPCCRRKVRQAELMRHATLVLRRTCPKCGQRYQIRLRPMGEIAKGVWTHEAMWVAITLA